MIFEKSFLRNAAQTPDLMEHNILFKILEKALRTISIKFFLVITTLYKTEDGR